jgi:nucleoid-associated protein YejK
MFRIFKEIEKVVAEAFQKFAVGSAVFAQSSGQSSLASALYKKRAQAVEVQQFALRSNDERMPELLQDLQLIPKAVLVFGF